VCKKLIKNSEPFGEKCQKTAGRGFFGLTIRGQLTVKWFRPPIQLDTIPSCHKFLRLSYFEKIGGRRRADRRGATLNAAT